MNKMDLKKKKNIVAGAAALAVAISTCGLGSYSKAEISVYNDNKDIMSEGYANAQTVENNNDEIDNGDLVSMLSEDMTVEEKDVYKDETVYVFADASGNTNKILVSEHLNNKDKADSLTDKTDLKDIVNVKGSEDFSVQGDLITWNAEGKDIYYQGTSDKELPVELKATYYLDGKEIAPDALAGKSGRVKIRFDYTNNTSVTKKINGKNEEIKIPFVAVTGMILNDNFSNVTVDNGKIISEGNKNIVVGYAMPGLMDSLSADEKDFADEISIPEYFEVSADVDDFSMDMTVTIVMNESRLNLSGNMDLTELDNVVNALSEAGAQLSDGSGELADGVTTLLGKMGEFGTGVGNLKSALDTLSDGSGALASGVVTINSSAQSINAGIASLDTALNTPMSDEEKLAVSNSAAETVQEQFAEGTDTYNYIYGQAASEFKGTMTSEATINAIYSGLYANLHDTLYTAMLTQYAAETGMTAEQVEAAMGAELESQISAKLYGLASGIASGIAEQGADGMGKSVVSACCQSAVQAAGQGAISGAEGAKLKIASQIEAVQDNGYSLVTGASALAAGTNTLSASVPQLTDGIEQIVSGAGTLYDGSAQLSAGVSQLSDGANALNDGIGRFNSEAIDNIVSTYNGDVKTLLERIRAVMEAATEYDTYTMLNNNEGTTKFIIKTEGISVD